MLGLTRPVTAQDEKVFTLSTAVQLGSVCVAGWCASEMLDKIDNPSGPEWPELIELTGFTIGVLVWRFWPNLYIVGKVKNHH